MSGRKAGGAKLSSGSRHLRGARTSHNPLQPNIHRRRLDAKGRRQPTRFDQGLARVVPTVRHQAKHPPAKPHRSALTGTRGDHRSPVDQTLSPKRCHQPLADRINRIQAGIESFHPASLTSVAVSTKNQKRHLWIGTSREALSDSLWFLPMGLAAGYGVLALVIVAFDSALAAWVPYTFVGGASSAQDLLSTIAAAILSMATLGLSITIVALQLASQQFSPRVMRTFFRDRGTKVAIGMLLGTFVYSILVLRSVVPQSEAMEAFVPSVAVSGAFLLTLISLGVFIYYVDHVAHAIRVVHIIEAVAEETRETLGALMGPGTVPDPTTLPSGPPDAVLNNHRRPGIVTDIDSAGLVALARRHHCCLGIVPYVGDFVPLRAPLARVWFDPGHSGMPTPEQLGDHVALGRERTMGQDAAFGFRQLVDIAEKALSPAMNDPTTAVQAIDQIHDLLRRLATADYPTGYYLDEPGALRAMRPLHRWDDYLDLALTEIRQYGATSVQVQRRLRALLADLTEATRDAPERARPITRHLELLELSVLTGLPEGDRELARVPDEQGLGGGPH